MRAGVGSVGGLAFGEPSQPLATVRIRKGLLRQIPGPAGVAHKDPPDVEQAATSGVIGGEDSLGCSHLHAQRFAQLQLGQQLSSDVLSLSSGVRALLGTESAQLLSLQRQLAHQVSLLPYDDRIDCESSLRLNLPGHGAGCEPSDATAEGAMGGAGSAVLEYLGALLDRMVQPNSAAAGSAAEHSSDKEAAQESQLKASATLPSERGPAPAGAGAEVDDATCAVMAAATQAEAPETRIADTAGLDELAGRSTQASEIGPASTAPEPSALNPARERFPAPRRAASQDASCGPILGGDAPARSCRDASCGPAAPPPEDATAPEPLRPAGAPPQRELPEASSKAAGTRRTCFKQPQPLETPHHELAAGLPAGLCASRPPTLAPVVEVAPATLRVVETCDDNSCSDPPCAAPSSDAVGVAQEARQPADQSGDGSCRSAADRLAAATEGGPKPESEATAARVGGPDVLPRPPHASRTLATAPAVDLPVAQRVERQPPRQQPLRSARTSVSRSARATAATRPAATNAARFRSGAPAGTCAPKPMSVPAEKRVPKHCGAPASASASAREPARRSVSRAALDPRGAELLAKMEASLDLVRSMDAQLADARGGGPEAGRVASLQRGADGCAAFYADAAQLHAVHEEQTVTAHALSDATRKSSLLSQIKGESQRARKFLTRLEALEGRFFSETRSAALPPRPERPLAGASPALRCLAEAHAASAPRAAAGDAPGSKECSRAQPSSSMRQGSVASNPCTSVATPAAYDCKAAMREVADLVKNCHELLSVQKQAAAPSRDALQACFSEVSSQPVHLAHSKPTQRWPWPAIGTRAASPPRPRPRAAAQPPQPSATSLSGRSGDSRVSTPAWRLGDLWPVHPSGGHGVADSSAAVEPLRPGSHKDRRDGCAQAPSAAFRDAAEVPPDERREVEEPQLLRAAPSSVETALAAPATPCAALVQVAAPEAPHRKDSDDVLLHQQAPAAAACADAPEADAQRLESVRRPAPAEYFEAVRTAQLRESNLLRQGWRRLEEQRAQQAEADAQLVLTTQSQLLKEQQEHQEQLQADWLQLQSLRVEQLREEQQRLVQLNREKMERERRQLELDRKQLAERRAACIIQGAARQLQRSRLRQRELAEAQARASRHALHLARMDEAVRQLGGAQPCRQAVALHTAPGSMQGADEAITTQSLLAADRRADEALTAIVCDLLLGDGGQGRRTAEGTLPGLDSQDAQAAHAPESPATCTRSAAAASLMSDTMQQLQMERHRADTQRQELALVLERERLEAARKIALVQEHRAEVLGAQELERALERLRAAEERQQLLHGIEAAKALGQELAACFGTQLGTAVTSQLAAVQARHSSRPSPRRKRRPRASAAPQADTRAVRQSVQEWSRQASERASDCSREASHSRRRPAEPRRSSAPQPVSCSAMAQAGTQTDAPPPAAAERHELPKSEGEISCSCSEAELWPEVQDAMLGPLAARVFLSEGEMVAKVPKSPPVRDALSDGELSPGEVRLA